MHNVSFKLVRYQTHQNRGTENDRHENAGHEIDGLIHRAFAGHEIAGQKSSFNRDYITLL